MAVGQNHGSVRWPVLACLAAAALLLASGPGKAEVAGPPPVRVEVTAAPSLGPEGLGAQVALLPEQGPGVFTVAVGIAQADAIVTTPDGVHHSWGTPMLEVVTNHTWTFEVAGPTGAMAREDPPRWAANGAEVLATPAAAIVQDTRAVSVATATPIHYSVSTPAASYRYAVSSDAPPVAHLAANRDATLLQGTQAGFTNFAWHASATTESSRGLQSQLVTPYTGGLRVEKTYGEPGSGGTSSIVPQIYPADPFPAAPKVDAVPRLDEFIVWSAPATVALDQELALRVFVPSRDLAEFGFRNDEDDEPVAPQVFLRIMSSTHSQPLVVHLAERGEANPLTVAPPAATSSDLEPAFVFACASLASAALGILFWLRCRGLEMPWWPALLFTRLRRPELLENATRRRIHEAIEAEPGIQYAPLRRRLQLPAGVLTHHLAVLEAHGLVASLRHGARRHLYAGPRAGQAPADSRERILQLVDGRPLDQREIAAAMPASRQAVGYHLQALLAAGRIRRQKDRDGRWRYEPSNPQQAH